MLIDAYRGTDPYAGYVVALLHAEDTMYERGGRTVTVTGGGAVSTTQKKFGAKSFLNPGNTNSGTNYVRVTAAAASDFLFTGAFTWEGWFYVGSVVPTYNMVFGGNLNFPVSGYWTFAIINTTRFLIFGGTAGGFIAQSLAVPLNQWTHLAVTRNASNVIDLWIDGGKASATTNASNTIGGNVGISGGHFDVGRGQAADNADLNAYYEEIRMTKGVARYTAAFTPPASLFQPYP